MKPGWSARRWGHCATGHWLCIRNLTNRELACRRVKNSPISEILLAIVFLITCLMSWTWLGVVEIVFVE